MDGHYRDAVLDSVGAIFGLMRERTGQDLDGATLATQTLSLEKPHLILSVACIPLSSFYHDGFDEKIVRFCFAKKEETLCAAAGRLQGLKAI